MDVRMTDLPTFFERLAISSMKQYQKLLNLTIVLHLSRFELFFRPVEETLNSTNTTLTSVATSYLTSEHETTLNETDAIGKMYIKHLYKEFLMNFCILKISKIMILKI